MLLALASKKKNYMHLQVRCTALADKRGSVSSTWAQSSEDRADCSAAGKAALWTLGRLRFMQCPVLVSYFVLTTFSKDASGGRAALPCPPPTHRCRTMKS